MSTTYKHSSSPVKTQRGLTLVEILVALMISAFLIAGVIQLFIGSKQTYRGHDALSRIQENGRFAMDRMSFDVRMADYPNDTPDPNAVQGTNNSITVQWNDGGAISRAYSIRCSGGGTPPCANGVPATLAVDLGTGAGPQDLIEGVDGMQIRYGVCGASTIYMNAAAMTAANWQNVCSVQIDLLLASLEDNMVTQPQTYFYQGANVTATDRRFRQAFSTTVAIRNRQL